MRPLTPLEAHLRQQLLALTGLTPPLIAQFRTRAAGYDVADLRLSDAVGAWLDLITDAPLTAREAQALADELTALLRRPVDVHALALLPAGVRAAAWDRAVPLWPAPAS